jgi:NTE family protein
MKIIFPRIFFSVLVLFHLLPVVLPLVSQGQKVALVLSGGGSRGAAHIGVIKALEKNGIPIDYIVGTSVGAIIGGLYATGYSPDEIEKLLSSEQFKKWAAGALDEKNIYYFRKEDPNASWASLDFNFRKKLMSQLPTNLITPYEMDYYFMEIFARGAAACQYDFNNLMVPFRCVAADVDSSQGLILRSGDLSSAVRASMTIPFVYKPITIDGKLVFDGGMYDNFPADVAVREFHPQVIIGSRVAERYNKPDRDDVISQLQTMLMNRQSDSILFKNSVMIVPELVKSGILSFDRTLEYIDSGYSAAIRKMKDIRKLVSDSITPEQLGNRRGAFRKKAPLLIFDSVSTTGLNTRQTKYVKQIIKHGKQFMSSEEVRKGYFRLIDEGFIRNIYPRAKIDPVTGYYDLLLDVQPSDNFNLQFGGNVSIGSNSEGFVELRYKYLWTDALHVYIKSNFGRFYNSFKGGGRIDFNSSLPWFIETNFAFNNYNYFRNTTYFFDDVTPSYVIQGEYYGDVQAGMPVTNKGKLVFRYTTASMESKYYQSNTFSRTDTADKTIFDFLSPQLALEFNSLNRKQYANAGALFRIGLSWVNGREVDLPGSLSTQHQTSTNYHHWFSFRFLWDDYFQSLGPLKLGFYSEAVISNQPLFNNYTASFIYSPAFEPLPDMQSVMLPAIRSTNWIGAGLKAIMKVYKKIDFRLEGYYFQPYKAILKDPESQDAVYGQPFSDHAFLGSATIVYHSFLGPLSLGMNYYDKTPDSFSFNLNFGYIIYDRRALP